MGVMRRLGRQILWGITFLGTVVWTLYLVWFREPTLDWGLVLACLLLAAALGWWPMISLGTAAVLACAVKFLPGLMADRWELIVEIFGFWALGAGWAMVAQHFLVHNESMSLEETKHFSVATPPIAPRAVGRVLERSERLPPPLPSGQDAASQDEFAQATFSQPPAPIQFLDPIVAHNLPPAPVQEMPRPTLPVRVQEPVKATPPPAEVPSFPQAAPLRTQEIDLKDFRSLLAAQKNSSAPQGEMPSGLMARKPTSTAGESGSTISSGGDGAPSETDPNSPNAILLEWYNQFSSIPWTEEALRRRYPGGSWVEPAAQHVREMLSIHTNGLVPTAPSDAFDLEDLGLFFRCERLFFMRRQGVSDLHGLSPIPPPVDWLGAYQELRKSARGGEGRVLNLPADALGKDAARVIVGRPDALVELGGHSEVVALFRPTVTQEPMGWTGAVGAAQLAVSASMGVPLSGGLVVGHLPAPGDRRASVRLTLVEDQATEFRKLDGALDRMRRILEGQVAPRAQSRASVCDACGRRHACPNHVGQRVRNNLSDSPSMFSRFQP
jgi:hypothetical protein